MLDGLFQPKISDLDIASEDCPICKGEGWVCENHETVKWNEGDPPCCGGAGMPCQCNPLGDFHG